MAGPGGKEIGRLTIRVLPDTDKFRETLKRELESINEKVEVELDLNADDFRSEVTRACRAAEAGQKVSIPVDVDRNPFDGLRPVVIPARVDEREVEREVDKIKPKPIDITPNVKPFDFPSIDVPSLEVPIDIDKPELDRELDKVENDLKPLEIPLLPRYDPQNRDWTPRIDPIDIPVQLNGNDLSKDVQKMRSEALKVLEKANMLIKLDADDEVLRGKITEARKELSKLKDFGEDILMDADVEPLLKKIKQVEQKLEVLNLQKSSPSVDLRKERLEKELADLTGRLESFEKKDYSAQASVKVDEGIANVAKLENALAKLTANREKLRFEVDDARVGNAFDFLNGKVDTFEQKVNGASDSVGKIGTAIERVGKNGTKFLDPISDSTERVGRNGTRFLEPIVDTVQNIGKGAANAGGKVLSFSDNLAAWGQKMQGIQAVTSQLFQVFGVLPAMATALAIAGAGITVAFGAVATAVAAIAPAIGFLGGALGVVMLGMDGIKAAAKTLKPEFDKLKESVSGTFQKELIPVFEKLRALFPTLTTGANMVAVSISSIGDKVANMLVGLDKAGVLGTVFQNIANALRDVGPGISDIVESLFRVMTLAEGFQALTIPINEFGKAFKASVTGLLADGSLSRAFSGLTGVLSSLSRAFVGLVENGIRAFAGAAPGTEKFINSLTGFFGRFNWERLGKAAGNVFEGLGEALDSVDDSTIEAITKAFEDLGEKFKDPKFQEGLKSFIELIPMAIDLITQLTDVFANVGRDLGKIGEFFTNVVGFIDMLDGKIDAFLRKYGFGWLADLFGENGALSAPIGASASGGSPFATWFEGLPSLKDLFGDEVTVDIDEDALSDSIRDAVKKGFEDALNKKAPAGGGGAGGTFTLTLNSAAFLVALDVVVLTAQAKFDAMSAAAGLFFINLYTLFNTQWPRIGQIASTQAELMRLNVVTSIQNMGADIVLALLTLQTSFRTMFGLIGTETKLAVDTMALGIVASLTAMMDQITLQLFNLNLLFFTAFSGLSLLVTTQMLLMQQAFLNGFLLMTQTATLQLEFIRLAFQTAFTNIGLLVTTQMTLITQALVAGLFLMATSANATLLTLQTYFTNAFVQINAIVLAQMAIVQSSMVTAMFALATNTNAALQTIVSYFQTACNQIVQIIAITILTLPIRVSLAMALMVAAVAAAFVSMVATAVSGIANFVSTIANGVSQANTWWDNFASSAAAAFDRFRSNLLSTIGDAMTGLAQSVQDGVGNAITFLGELPGRAQSALGSLGSTLVSAGKSLMEGLLNGIKSAAEAVYSYVSSIAGKIQALKGPLPYDRRVLIPNGKALMVGLQSGLSKGFAYIERDLARYTNAFANIVFAAPSMAPWEGAFGTEIPDAIDAAKGLADQEMNGVIESDGFGGIGDKVAEALEGWGVEIDGNGLAKLVNKSNTRKARRR